MVQKQIRAKNTKSVAISKYWWLEKKWDIYLSFSVDSDNAVARLVQGSHKYRIRTKNIIKSNIYAFKIILLA